MHEGGAPNGSQSFLTEEGRKKISEAMKKHWAQPEYRAMIKEKMKGHKPCQKCIDKGREASSKAHKGVTPTNARPVLQLDLNTLKIINEFKSASHAAEAVSGEKSNCSNILKVCKNQRRSAYGYKWKFKE